MARWDFAVALNGGAKEPIFLQVARAIAGEIRRGRLRAGERIPGTRTLAESLSVHRNTIVAAYSELESEGWIETREAQGSFVCQTLPERKPKRFSARPSPVFADRPGFDLAPSSRAIARESLHVAAQNLVSDGLIALSSGLPDVRLAPRMLLARAYRRGLRQKSARLLDYGDSRGLVLLRKAVATMLRETRGITATENHIVITRGSQMALALVANLLASVGGDVAVEAFGYSAAWGAFAAARIRCVPIAVDREGICVSELERTASERPIRAVYVTPHHQYPTMVTLSASRRLALLDLARRRRFAIVEDDYDHEFHFAGRPVLPLASADEAGVVLYIGTLSKVLAPGLRLGYLAAPRAVVDEIAEGRFVLDRQGDHVLEAAVAELIDDGELARHIWRSARIYAERREHTAMLLRKHLANALSFELPAGGMALWGEVSRSIDVEAWCECARKKGVAVHSARRFAFDKKTRPFVRIGFASLTEKEMQSAIKALALSIPRR